MFHYDDQLKNLCQKMSKKGGGLVLAWGGGLVWAPVGGIDSIAICTFPGFDFGGWFFGGCFYGRGIYVQRSMLDVPHSRLVLVREVFP